MTKLSNLNSALYGMRSAVRATELSFAVQKSAMLDADTARLLITIPAAHQPHATETAMAEAVARTYPGVRYLSKSLYKENGTDLYGCFVTRKAKTMTLEQASAAGFKAVSDTVFQDANDDVWSKVGDGADAYLSISREEDIASLLGAVRQRAIATASVGVALEEDFAAGDAVYYYDPARETAGFGIGTDNNRLLYNPDMEALVEVSAQQVIYVDNRSPVRVDAETASTKADLLNYMKQLYGHHPEFFRRIRDIITNHVMVA